MEAENWTWFHVSDIFQDDGRKLYSNFGFLSRCVLKDDKIVDGSSKE